MIRLFNVYYPIRQLVLLGGEALLVWTSFLIAAVLAVVGMIAYGLIVGQIEPIDWRATDDRQVVLAVPPTTAS